jgi:hypothetical protein
MKSDDNRVILASLVRHLPRYIGLLAGSTSNLGTSIRIMPLG